jgi:Uma2 family endonuclease
MRWLISAFRKHNEPEPDLLVTKRSIRDYNSIPTRDDLWLVIEVSDTTLQFDLTVKAHLYARAGIVEYWVVAVQEKSLSSTANL